jgi:hypothetical protein
MMSANQPSKIDRREETQGEVADDLLGGLMLGVIAGQGRPGQKSP